MAGRSMPPKVAAVNRVFRQRRDALDYFGYELMDEKAAA